MNNQGPIAQPTLPSVLDALADRISSAINCVRVGTVLSFDVGTQSVTVQLVNPAVVYNQQTQGAGISPNPNVYPIPPLVQVPAFVLSGGSAFIGMPISAGDIAIVLFNDRDLDPWWSNGTTGAPAQSDRLHSLADGIALVGIRPATNAIPGLPSDGQHITFGNDVQTLLGVIQTIVLALTALNAKTGPDASAAILAVTTAADELLQ